MWYLPENLKKTEKIYFSGDVNKVENSNDFGSYKIFLQTGNVNKSWINAHNDIYPRKKIVNIKRVLHYLISVCL